MNEARIKELREQSLAVSREYREAMTECLDEVERLRARLHEVSTAISAWDAKTIAIEALGAK